METLQTETIQEFRELVRIRQDLISSNRSNRIRGLPTQPLPPKPVAPERWETSFFDGKDWSYAGTTDYGVSKDDAILLTLDCELPGWGADESAARKRVRVKKAK